MRGSVQTVPLTPDDWERHTIRVRAQSTLASYLQPAITLHDGEQKPWELAFMPHRGVEKLAPGLRSCAQSEDGTVVAFERRDGAFGLGMIGRLDWGLDQAYGMTLFETFLHACWSFDRTRQQKNGWEATCDTICATVYDLVSQGQSLLPVPQTSHPSSKGSGSIGQERFRQRSHPPTKEELNRMRRQRLRIATR